MSGGVGRVVAAGAAEGAARPSSADTKETRELDEAARQFEEIFVRSVLASSPLGKRTDAYGDMAVGALASALTQGKGLGLGELIKRAVELSHAKGLKGSP
jgi:Rod binding domain-containing protein